MESALDELQQHDQLTDALQVVTEQELANRGMIDDNHAMCRCADVCRTNAMKERQQTLPVDSSTAQWFLTATGQ